MTRAVFDTNVLIDWLNRGRHAEVLFAPGLVRYLSAVVLMELRAGAETPKARRALDRLVHGYASAGRIVAPTPYAFDHAGVLLNALAHRGRGVRRASLVNDVLIGLSTRALGATLYTRDAADFAAIRALVDFDVRGVPS